ncbi:MAG: hypothetical protein WCG27_05620, partial [Pseudomonadota bacterium]
METEPKIDIEKETELEMAPEKPKKSKAKAAGNSNFEEEFKTKKDSFLVGFDYFMHAAIMVFKNTLAKFVEVYRKFFSIDQRDSAQIHENLGKRYYKKGQYDHAIDAFES